MPNEKVSYHGRLDADRQITTEERIAAAIADARGDQDAEDNLGREILYLVLREFRPDLFVDMKPTDDPVRCMKWAFENLLKDYKQAAAGGIHEMSGDIEGCMAALDTSCKKKREEFMNHYREYRKR